MVNAVGSAVLIFAVWTFNIVIVSSYSITTQCQNPNMCTPFWEKTECPIVQYAYEPGLIARLLGVVLERPHTLTV